eukprot:COSAG06_NODE_55197_length_290_cov_4.335079_2_plen_54_part_01
MQLMINICNDDIELIAGSYYALKCLSKTELVRNGQVPHLMNEKDVLQAIHHPTL